MERGIKGILWKNYGHNLSATLTQKTERNGSWYIKLSNDQLKDGDRTNLTIGGSGVF